MAAVARGRNWVAFRGTAGAVEAAFGTEIHRFKVNGETHFANATEPTIPAAFDGVVSEIHGLTNFRLRPAARPSKQIVPKGLQPLTRAKAPTFQRPMTPPRSTTSSRFTAQVLMAPIRKLSSLGKRRSRFQTFSNSAATSVCRQATRRLSWCRIPLTPGISNDDLPEADLDIEWSGAVARNATIIYVYSDDVEVSAQYAIDQNLAPVLSMSYGLCEALTTGSDARIQQAYARQANAQGMTWITASGDSGAADCVGVGTRTSLSLAVGLPAALPGSHWHRRLYFPGRQRNLLEQFQQREPCIGVVVYSRDHLER